MSTTVVEVTKSEETFDRTSPVAPDDLDTTINEALEEHSEGSICVGSSTGEVHGLAGRLAAVREHSGISMCFWGAFGK